MNNENKQMILEVIDGQYRNYNIKQNQGFMGFYNNIYKFYQRNQGEYNSTQEINKKVVQESIGFIKKNITRYATNSNSSDNYYSNQQQQQQQQQDTISLKQIDSTDLRYVKDDKFDMKLKKREDDFSGLMNRGKPDEIDFTFNKDEELPAESLNKILGQTLADREKELANITNTYNTNGLEDAAKWLKINEDDKEKGRKKLKDDKKVSFNLTEDNVVNTLLSKLKPTENNEENKEDFMVILNTILNKQDEILNMLRNMKKENVEEKVEKKVEELETMKED
tara:strand:+ start:3898 stop:4737 length:840 start_codon:yes stop_codon:yes gene_type:complete